MDPTSMVFSGKSFQGSKMDGGIVRRDIPRYERMYLDGKTALDRLASSQICFDDLNSSFDRLDRGEVVRQILLLHR